MISHLFDVINNIVYLDDSQIIELHVFKIVGKVIKTTVDVYELE